MEDITVDEAYSMYEENCKAPSNYDIYVEVFEYNPVEDEESRFTNIFKGYFPYPKLFQFQSAHQFPKFMIGSKGVYDPETRENVFHPIKGKYYTFILIYQFYRLKKKQKVKWKRFDIFYK